MPLGLQINPNFFTFSIETSIVQDPVVTIKGLFGKRFLLTLFVFFRNTYW